MAHIQSGTQLVGEYPRAAHLDHCLVYMNDLPSQVHNGKLLQYADDTALICTGEDYREVRT